MRFLKYFAIILIGVTINHFTLLYKTKKIEKPGQSVVTFSEKPNLENIHKNEINRIIPGQSLDNVSGKIKPVVFTNPDLNEWGFNGIEIYSHDMFSQALKYTGKANELSLILERRFDYQGQTEAAEIK